MFENDNRNVSADPGEFVLRARQALPANIVTAAAGVGAAGFVEFLPSGAINGIAGNVQFCIPTTQPPQNKRQVTIAAPAGRMRVEAIDNAGVCP